MKTIDTNESDEIVIKNSRFITLLFKIDESSKIDEILDKVRNDYPKATHYCYAYRMLNSSKSSDDGEPGGTAGIPMLNVLIKEDLVNVLAVTVRYFGGIKLGAGGLVRAYTKSLTNTLSKTLRVDLEEGFVIRITTNYSNQKQLDYLLKDVNIISKQYDKDIEYIIELPARRFDLLEMFSYEIISSTLIKVI